MMIEPFLSYMMYRHSPKCFVSVNLFNPLSNSVVFIIIYKQGSSVHLRSMSNIPQLVSGRVSLQLRVLASEYVL